MGKLRIGLIGAGRRIVGNFLPVLTHAADDFDIRFIHARRADPLKAVAERWKVEPLFDLADLPADEVDVVALSIPVAANPEVVARLMPHADRIALVIDTPITNDSATSIRLARDFAQFRATLPTEDYISFPIFRLAREAVERGLIGTVRRVVLHNLGYRYHGLALIRSLAKLAPVQLATTDFVARDTAHIEYRLRGGVRGQVFGPYAPEIGAMIVVGDKATLTTVPQTAPRKDLYVVGQSPSKSGGGIAFEVVGGDGVALRRELADFDAFAALHENQAPLNVMRSYGLTDVFRSFAEDNIYRRYTIGQALSDSLVSGHAERHRVTLPTLVTRGLTHA